MRLDDRVVEEDFDSLWVTVSVRFYVFFNN